MKKNLLVVNEIFFKRFSLRSILELAYFLDNVLYRKKVGLLKYNDKFRKVKNFIKKLVNFLIGLDLPKMRYTSIE